MYFVLIEVGSPKTGDRSPKSGERRPELRIVECSFLCCFSFFIILSSLRDLNVNYYTFYLYYHTFASTRLGFCDQYFQSIRHDSMIKKCIPAFPSSVGATGAPVKLLSEDRSREMEDKAFSPLRFKGYFYQKTYIPSHIVKTLVF